MRKLLHLVFAIWKSGKLFDPQHYPWDRPAHVDTPDHAPPVQPAEPCEPTQRGVTLRVALPDSESQATAAQTAQAAGLKLESEPARKEVTTACASNLSENQKASERTFLDFAHLKRQLPLLRVLDHLGLSSRLRGSGPQRRCACPIHRGDARGRTFSVNLDEQVFHCFDATCGKQGDVIDLWAALHQMSLREAALDLVATFQLEPAPQAGTEKRHG